MTHPVTRPVAVRRSPTPPYIDTRNAASSTEFSSRAECCRHAVQFYEDDGFLIRSIAEYLLNGDLQGEGNAVVIATRAHLDALSGRLREAGIDVEDLIRCRRYVPLDAKATLNMLKVGGALSAEAFERHVGTLIASMTAEGFPLYAFGEMVQLLWNDGDTAGALQLEEFWNELGTRYRFELLCAYSMKGFAHEPTGESFRSVCNAHMRVLPAETYDVTSTRSEDDRLRVVALLQQKAAALELEMARRKQLEETTRRREAELTAFVETASSGLHWVDENGTIIWANQAELDLLGYAYSEYVGKSIWEVHADRAVIEELFARLNRGEKVRDFEARLRCKDGTLKTVSIDSSVLWENGHFVHTQCFTRDITEQRKAENASRLLASIVSTSDDAIISKNLDGIVTSWNQGAQRIFGYTASEMIGRSITTLIPEDRQGEEPQILSRLRRGERVDHFETIRRRKDGALLDISLTISVVKDSKGNVIGASKIARDITDRKRAEKALQVAREQLAQANEDLERRVAERTESLREAVAQMEEFSYTVSHDLRAPLRGIQGYSEALIEDYDQTLDEEAKRCLRRIADNAARLDKMVMDVLTFSRISRAELPLARVELDSLVREIVEHYPALQPPRAKLEIAPLHDVVGHEPSLTQIVSNLLSNAVKFVAPGVLPEVRVWTEISEAENAVRLWIQDNGIGIKPAQQTRLFKMFERVHPDLPYEGTGVGLAIVRKAATRMGGNVGVESDGVNGTRFYVRLPASKSK